MCSNCFGSVIFSIILGAIFGILIGTGVITILAPFFFGLVLILSVLILVLYISVLLSPVDAVNTCFCKNASCLIGGSEVAIVVSVVGLALSLATTLSLTVIGIFAFLASAAFLVGLISFADLIICIARKRCCN